MKNLYRYKIYEIDIVAPTKSNFKKIAESIKLIKRYEKRLFKKLLSLKAILVYPKKDYDNELFTKERIWICHSQTIKEADEIYLASLLLHEVTHLIQSDSGRKNTGVNAEKEAYQVQRKFLAKMNQKNSVEWLDKQYKRKWWIYRAKRGKKSRHFPSYKHFRKLLNLYKSGKLNLKKI